MRWNQITLAGVGLLGGSLGMALRERGLATEVVGYVRRRASIAESLGQGAVDRATCDLADAVAGADLVVLCTPLAQMQPLLELTLPVLKKGAIVTDVGSAKSSVVEHLEPMAAAAGACFIGSHPMAGGEQRGVVSARADLFEGSLCVVTPTPRSNRAALRKVRRLWESVGCKLIQLSPSEHDTLVSRSSHLPQVVAAALVNSVLEGGPDTQARLCAGGFRDTTRIASGSPEMWRDIALSNDRNLADSIDLVLRELTVFKQQLKARDSAKILEFYTRAAARRNLWLKTVAADACRRQPPRKPAGKG